MPQPDLTGAIDLHIHVAPDLRPRKMDGLALAHAAAARGMRGVLIKSHYGPTWEGSYYVSQVVKGVDFFGGVALNQHVGGFNPPAVETALRLGAKQIWMPTVSAANDRQHHGQPGGLTILREGKLRQEVLEILALIAEADAILGTGHLSVAEIQQLVPQARAAGMNHILITHPEHPIVAMPISVQKELRDQGAMFERCYVSIVDFNIPVEQVAAEIREVGVETTVLATDFGQDHNLSPPDGLAEYITKLKACGFTTADFDRMIRSNPAALLGLGPSSNLHNSIMENAHG